MAGHWIDRGDLWKSKARTLQLQLRERLRVVVDRRRRRPVFSGDGYLSSSMKRWIQRFRNFRSESLASSSMFCRRRVSKNLYAEDESVITRMLQAVAVPILGNVCHVFMHGFNRVQVYGAEKLHEALLHRPKDKPLITVSNHVASMDDPLVIASLLPPRVLMDAQSLRWTLCARDRCFKSPLTSAFFRCVKVLPVSRGDGVHQKGLDLAISKLNNGGWVHIFPEGSRSRDGGRTMGSAKRGVGRLVLDADNTPVVVPFVHTGMQEIMPIGANFPRIGKTVTVLIGDPIEFDDLLNGEDTELAVKGNLYDAISSRIGNRLHELKLQLDRLALDQSLQMTNPPLQSTNQAPGIMHQVDWESFGMDNFMISQDDLASKLERKTEHQQLGPHSSQTGPSISYQRPGLGHECGTVSRIEGYMGFTDLMGFAARGLLLNRSRDKPAKLREVSPLKAWRRFLEASLVQL